MVHGYHNLQQWNHWLSTTQLGERLLTAEEKYLSDVLQKHSGKHALLLGVPKQYALLKTTALPCHTLASPIIHKDSDYHYVESTLDQLPFLTGSLDLVIIPHTLEFIANPKHLVNEACRIVKPEGLLIICGFNPYSWWGLKKIWSKKQTSMPWSLEFLEVQKIKNWLKLSDFKLEKQLHHFYLPFSWQKKISTRFSFCTRLTQYLPFGGAYILVARAKVIPLSPIRMKWKQQLGSIRMATTVPTHIATYTNHRTNKK